MTAAQPDGTPQGPVNSGGLQHRYELVDPGMAVRTSRRAIPERPGADRELHPQRRSDDQGNGAERQEGHLHAWAAGWWWYPRNAGRETPNTPKIPHVCAARGVRRVNPLGLRTDTGWTF